MKKWILAAIITFIILLLSSGFFLIHMYQIVGVESVPAISFEAFGITFKPDSFTWNTAVFRGFVYKEFNSPENTGVGVDVGVLNTADIAADVPEGYTAVFELLRDGDFVSSGEIIRWQEGLLSEAGEYSLHIVLRKPKEKRKSYGNFQFLVRFTVPLPEPEFKAGKADLVQGEIFVIKLSCVPDGIKPTAKTNLGLSVFTPLGGGGWFVAIPVGNTKPPGVYKVAVVAGDCSWEENVVVSAYKFSTQNLVVDTSSAAVSEASSAQAYQQYREKIPPLFDTWDEEMYWEGTFAWPLVGRMTTEFGSIRYTNGNMSNPRHHFGVDIAANEGTLVKAPNGGRVVFAEYLLNTGNTVAIEHGGGFKSYYFHMSALGVKTHDMVQKGDIIGKVGSTGYSTGPHLHYEMRIGNQAVNPVMLLDSSASLYSLSLEEAGQKN